ncbi:MAG: PQQ-binding-like beta-propeller repeat protein [Candidatus Eremiobacteraeota bacterium]|nr:PQQ-binding-like beta-propeller repeat protein [Candidatus Eremiobacteraeota bacterium]
MKKTKQEKRKCPLCGRFHRITARFCTTMGRPLKEDWHKAADPLPDDKTRVYKDIPGSNRKPLRLILPPSPGGVKKTVEMKISRCPRCGTLTSKPGAKFCVGCGFDLCKEFHRETSINLKPIIQCPYIGCGKTIKENLNFCPECNRQLRTCSECRGYTDVWKNKCIHCNKKMELDGRSYPMFKGDPQRTGNSSQKITPALKRKWTYPDKRQIAGILSSPIVYKGLVYYGSGDMNLHALNQYTGAVVWKRPTSGFIASTPAIYNDIIYAGSCDGKVYASDAQKGKPAWVFPRKRKENIGSITANILACKQGVFVVNNRGELYRLDLETGKVIWKFESGENGNGKEECALDEEGREILSSPAIFENMVFVASRNGRVFCVDSGTGREIWRFPADHPLQHRFISTPAVCNDHCYIPDRSGHFYALSLKTGEDSWVYAVDLDGVVEGSPSVGYGKIFIGTQDEYLVALDLRAGGEIWRMKNDKIRLLDAIFSTPTIVSNNLVFFGSNSGYLYCRSIDSGETVWKEKLDSPIRSAPVVSDGFLYVTTTGGYIYAFIEK